MIMNPITIPRARSRDALDLMARFNISGVPVTDSGGHLVGILTNRDLRFETDLDQPVSDLMTTDDLDTVPVGTTLEEAKSLLQRYKIEKLLVVDERGYHLKGLITVKDIQKKIKFPIACKDEMGRLAWARRSGVGGIPRPGQGPVEVHVDVLVLDSSHGHSEVCWTPPTEPGGVPGG